MSEQQRQKDFIIVLPRRGLFLELLVMSISRHSYFIESSKFNVLMYYNVM